MQQSCQGRPVMGTESKSYDRRIHRRRRWRSGVTLVELVISSTVTLVLVFAIGLLIDGGNRAWLHTYDTVHSQANEDAIAITTAFGSIGRRSNRAGYILYHAEGGLFTPVAPDASRNDQVLSGNAIEFRYWDVPLNPSDSHRIMDSNVTATAYALFYLDGGQLKVDYGPYPPGAIPAGGGRRNTAGVRTQMLADDVSACADIGPFSHTAGNGTGRGCVRLKLVLTDPDSGDTTTVMSAALMRNIWPR